MSTEVRTTRAARSNPVLSACSLTGAATELGSTGVAMVFASTSIFWRRAACCRGEPEALRSALFSARRNASDASAPARSLIRPLQRALSLLVGCQGSQRRVQQQDVVGALGPGWLQQCVDAQRATFEPGLVVLEAQPAERNFEVTEE